MSTLVVMFHRGEFDEAPKLLNNKLLALATLPTDRERLVSVKTVDGVLLVAYDEEPTEADQAGLVSAIEAHPCDRCVLLVHQSERTPQKVRMAQKRLPSTITALKLADVRGFSHTAADPLYRAVLAFLDGQTWSIVDPETTRQATWTRLRHDVVGSLAATIIRLEDADERAAEGDAAGAAAIRDSASHRLEQIRQQALVSVQRAREDLQREAPTGSQPRLAALQKIEGLLAQGVEPAAAKVHEWRGAIVRAFGNSAPGDQ